MLARVTRVARVANQLPRPMAAAPLFAVPKAGFRTGLLQPALKLQARKQPLVSVAACASASARSLHSSAARRAEDPKRSPLDSLPSVDSARLVNLGNEAIAKLQGASTHQLFEWTSIGLVSLTPVAVLLSPHFICFPVDFALGLVLPLHMHIGLVGVAEDYVPRGSQGLARLALAVLSVLTAIGLLKVNLCGAGITESVKSLWRRPKETKEQKVARLQEEQQALLK